jgi:hypothetical protein
MFTAFEAFAEAAVTDDERLFNLSSQKTHTFNCLEASSKYAAGLHKRHHKCGTQHRNTQRQQNESVNCLDCACLVGCWGDLERGIHVLGRQSEHKLRLDAGIPASIERKRKRMNPSIQQQQQVRNKPQERDKGCRGECARARHQQCSQQSSLDQEQADECWTELCAVRMTHPVASWDEKRPMPSFGSTIATVEPVSVTR